MDSPAIQTGGATVNITRVAWIILIISALTDLIINAGTSIMAAMMATGNASLPTKAVWILAAVGGLVQMARTIQQALKTASEHTNSTLLPARPPQYQKSE
jgi:hypothetical protein